MRLGERSCMELLMDLSEALSRIGDIHAQLAKTETYRGFRPVPVALSGLTGLGAALVQPFMTEPDNAQAFLRYWLIAGLVCGMIGVSGTLLHYLACTAESQRQRTR